MRIPKIACLVLAATVSTVAPVASWAQPSPSPMASTEAAPAGLERTTFEFATRGAQKLYLDRIIDRRAPVVGKRPVIIYSFGGGWETGQRDDPNSNDFLNFLAAQGYEVIAIDYRLGIKEAKAKGELNAATTVDMYLRAIQWGIEDLFDATSLVLRHADDWGIDRNQVVILGSSAGAINSLTAEYNVANNTPLAQAHLPQGFRYAGVISMAGAFWLKGADTPLEFKSKPAPIMFLHGPKDQLVTYDESHQGFAGYGPAYFTRKFDGPDYPKWFIDVDGGDHLMSFAPMLDYRYEILAFLQKFVREHQQISLHTVEADKTPKTLLNLFQLYGSKLKARPGSK